MHGYLRALNSGLWSPSNSSLVLGGKKSKALWLLNPNASLRASLAHEGWHSLNEFTLPIYSHLIYALFIQGSIDKRAIVTSPVYTDRALGTTDHLYI